MMWLIGWVLSAQASPLEVERCLRANDVPCAEQALGALVPGATEDPVLLALSARVAFHAGDFERAYDQITRAVERGWQDDWNTAALYERTLYATAHWAEVPVERQGRASRFRVRFRPGLDEVLLDGAGDALLAAERHITPRIGATPPGTTLLEIYPDSKSFIAASSLTEADVRTTGVVALSKWTRLLVTSPRALARGYDWKDTIAHEYIHLVVAHNTDDRAPVWLQEAIAKYLDNRWRDGTDRWRLSARSSGLLAAALRDDDLVGFDEMHPSLAKLPTAERAALAYAQLSALMAYCFEVGGEDVLLRALPDVRDGTDPRLALARAAGFDSFDALQAGWLAWVRKLDLSDVVVGELPTVFAEDGVDDGELDPVLSRREDLHRFVRLGTLLRERGRPRAALVEYDKARDPEEPGSPYLANMIAQAHLALGDAAAAERELQASLARYPDFALTHKTLGQLFADGGRVRDARAAFGAAAELNPYDPQVQAALQELALQVGDAADAGRRERIVRILRRGGSDQTYSPIHTRVGEVVVPGGAGDGSADDLQASFRGELAPAFRVEDLAGQPFTLGELAGQVVVVDFWATWCGPCRAAIPHLAALDARDGVTVVGLTDEHRSKVEPFARANQLTYRVGLDIGGSVKRRYRVSALPTAFVVDRRGRVAAVVVGGGDAAHERLRAAVDEAGAL